MENNIQVGQWKCFRCGDCGLPLKNREMKKLKNVHPGEILLEEFLTPLELSAYRLSKDIGIPQTRISEIVKGNRRITADTALRLSKYFGNSAKASPRKTIDQFCRFF